MRADRLLSLMLLLRARGRMTADELADRLEVSVRTVYRDIEALGYAGIPVYTQSGTNGGVYLDEHYRISLTGLSKSELQSLFAPRGAGPLRDLGLERSTEESLLKLLAALPAVHRSEVERMRERIYIDPRNWYQSDEPLPFLEPLQQAVWEDRIIEIAYRRPTGKHVVRTLQAYGLVAKGNIWYLIAHPTDAEQMRTYRVARIQELALTGHTFERDPAFDLMAHWQATSRAFEQATSLDTPPFEAVVRVSQEGLRHFEIFMLDRYEPLDEPDADGWRSLRVIFWNFEDARACVLGLGTQAKVLDPPELYASVIETARAILAFHGVL